MSVEKYTWKQLFALSLSAPLAVDWHAPAFDTLRNFQTPRAQEILSGWWDISDSGDLHSMLDWLEHEGGHWEQFQHLQNRLERMTYYERQRFIRDLKDSDRREYLRAGVVERYRLDLGRFTILAYDLCRITLLVRLGYSAGWVSEIHAWEVLMRQADHVISYRMWWSPMDYLHSFLVGYAFAMHEDAEGNLRRISKTHGLLTSVNSPWLSYAKWPQFEPQTQGHTDHYVH